MSAPAWVLLTDPVPAVVTERAVELLAELALGDTRTECVGVDCQTHTLGAATQVLLYVCETHYNDCCQSASPHKGITVYGLV